jgi:DNA-binding CsgD family transcriptional regulator
MKDLNKPKLSGPETGYFQANNEVFLSLVVKEINQVDLPTEASFLKTFDFVPFGVAISESITSDFFYANKVLLQGLDVPLLELQEQGLQLFNKRGNKNMQLLWKKLKEFLSNHKQSNHEPFGCIVRYSLQLPDKRMKMMHNINEFFPASGHRLFLHIFLPDPESNFNSNEIYIPCRNFRWKSLRVNQNSQQIKNPLLSNRENEIFEEVIKGKTSQEISEIVGLSIHTVKIHRRNILKKLEVHNSLEALAKLNV